jgi:hypothetical protein
VHENGKAHELPRSAPAQLHRLTDLVQRGDAEGFAQELNLDPHETQQWFEQGFTAEGYGATVIQAVGTLVLRRIVIPSKGESRAHG